MTKRPDQHNLDQNEAQATDYKFRRQTEEGNRRDAPETLEGGRGNSMTPREDMNARTRQSEKDREKELERAAGVRERGEGNHPSSGDDSEPEGDRSDLRTSGKGGDQGTGTDEALGKSGERSHDQSSSERQKRGSAGDDQR